jgi:serine carboxypeptidase-like clade 2
MCAGESYSGHYIPLLADAIQRHNRRSPGGPINLRGFLIGNAWTDAATENKAAVDYW